MYFICVCGMWKLITNWMEVVDMYFTLLELHHTVQSGLIDTSKRAEVLTADGHFSLIELPVSAV